MTKQSLTQEYLKECFDYCPSTGALTWKERPASHFKQKRRHLAFITRCAGKNAGHINDQGYCFVSICGKRHRAHRLIYMYMTGDMPVAIDHINHIRNDNRWENLRVVTTGENNRNLSPRKDSESGVPGVRFHKQTGKWRVRAFDNHYGLYENMEDAIAKRKSINPDLGFHPNHGA